MTYLRFDASGLPGEVGADGPGGSRLSDGRSGYISFGPYFSGDPGVYVAGFYMRRTGGPVDQAFDIDVVSADLQLARRSIAHSDLFDDIPMLTYVNFELHEPTDRIEVRLYVEANIAIEIQSLTVFKTPPRSWGGI